MNRVVGIGTVMYRFVATNGDVLFLPAIAYHLETAEIRLFSPQAYHQRWGGSSTIDGDEVVMHLPKQLDYNLTHKISIEIEKKGSNLPMIYRAACTDAQRKEIGPHFRSALATHMLNFYSPWKVVEDEIEYEFDHFRAFMAHPCVSDDRNANLSSGQKELLLWHWKLGISMHRIQELMKEQRAVDREGKHSLMPCVIKPKHPTASTCAVPHCESCHLARAKRRNPEVAKKQAIEEKEGVLAADQYEVGDFVSMDQFNCGTPGRRYEGYGREGARNRFHGGTIFNDAASGAIWLENQVSTGTGETLNAKERFEEWLWELCCAEVKRYHSDNGVFISEDF